MIRCHLCVIVNFGGTLLAFLHDCVAFRLLPAFLSGAEWRVWILVRLDALKQKGFCCFLGPDGAADDCDLGLGVVFLAIHLHLGPITKHGDNFQALDASDAILLSQQLIQRELLLMFRFDAALCDVFACNFEVSQQALSRINQVHLTRNFPAKPLHKESLLHNAVIRSSTLQNRVCSLAKQREDTICGILNNLCGVLDLQLPHVWRLDERSNGDVTAAIVVAVVANSAVNA